MDMEKKYDHKRVESGKYENWKQAGYFKSGDKTKKTYTIVIPPPNVTGKLHLGHAWDNTLQDIIIRKKRMEGYDALYLPGMDHAGIATQAKIDNRLKERGINRFEMGREAFLVEAWSWKEEYARHIRDQWAALGLSVDYEKERFTLDEGLNKAVNEVFFRLYDKGLIYRKERIINWDVQAKTALSNIEVEHEAVEGALYYMKYHLEDGSDHILIATTRPETIFADTAVIVHPEDDNRRKFVGKRVYIPTTDRLIPVIDDAYVDREFGTGALKVTPAHDPNDFEIGERHALSMPLCMEEDGKMNALAHKYEGMARFECRKALVKDMQHEGLITKIEKHIHNVGHSERTGVMVEPRLSKQWFVKMTPLAKQALEESTARFIPARFEKIFNHWMEDIQDWCISRQLWWGHRIPAYYKGDDVYVGENPPAGYVQDEDVLDTWFSSALWPFSTLGWPEKTDDFKRYYPTQTMVTGYDIIFFWVARMIFQGIEFTGKTPFDDVLIHGLIRDEKGRKMSKSLGNGVDPMDVKEAYGMDTLRYFLTTNSAPGQDLRFETPKVESSWNYINKLWNISRFIMLNIGDMDEKETAIDMRNLPLKDRHILSRLHTTIKEVNRNYDRFEFGEAAKALYKFSWDEVAAWYVETSKLTLQNGTPHEKIRTKAILRKVWLDVLRMLHPFMPFVTEEIYQQMPFTEQESIMIDTWPKAEAEHLDPQAVKDFETIQALISRVRNVRNTYDVPFKQKIAIHIEAGEKTRELFAEQDAILKRFLNPKTYEVKEKVSLEEKSLSYVYPAFTLYIPLGSLVDLKAELEKQEAERVRIENEIRRARTMLANEKFVAKAPKAKVDAEKDKLNTYEKQLEHVKNRIEELKRDV